VDLTKILNPQHGATVVDLRSPFFKYKQKPDFVWIVDLKLTNLGNPQTKMLEIQLKLFIWISEFFCFCFLLKMTKRKPKQKSL
jgi:hypothetical protein